MEKAEHGEEERLEEQLKGFAASLLRGRTPKSGAPQKRTLSVTGKGGDLAFPPHGFKEFLASSENRNQEC